MNVIASRVRLRTAAAGLVAILLVSAAGPMEAGNVAEAGAGAEDPDRSPVLAEHWAAQHRTLAQLKAERKAKAAQALAQRKMLAARAQTASKYGTPWARPTIVELIRDSVKTKSHWMKLVKAVPVLHADRMNDYEEVEVTATGYTAGKESTGKSPGHPQYGITFSGVKVRRDVFSTIAADREVFPIGTVLHIPGYGYGVVADTGSAIKGRKIDLYFETIDQVFKEWGKKKVKVRVIRRGGGKLTEEDLNRLNDLIRRDESGKRAV